MDMFHAIDDIGYFCLLYLLYMHILSYLLLHKVKIFTNTIIVGGLKRGVELLVVDSTQDIKRDM